MFYNLAGDLIVSKADAALGDAHLDYEYDEATNANYTVLRIFQTKLDGSKQYPFVYVPNGTGAAVMSTLEMAEQHDFIAAINAGTFYHALGTDKPRGVTIQNGVLVQQGVVTEAPYYPLTIDNSGNLSYAAPDANGNTLISNGIVSAVCGWDPIIIDYADSTEVITDGYEDTSNAQRQIIGQWGNGDYCILTCEGRDYDHSDGWTIAEARTICKKLGLKFAYNLDGGGSTETVIGKKQINTIYENDKGRLVPTYIIFNGSDTFSV
jgi:exopolysaccharide biosynthesis protein